MPRFPAVWSLTSSMKNIQLFVDYLTQQAPDYVQVKVTPLHGGEGYVCPIDHPAYQAAEKGFEKAFGKNHWPYVVEEVFLSSAILNKFWASKPF